MRRRDLISLLGGAVVGRPFAAQAQQTGKVSRIGYLGASSASLERRSLDAFRQTLRDLGHVEGDNTTIEYRWAEGDDSQLPGLAVELVHLKVDVIVTLGTPGTLAAKQATNTIPIVCASFGNPIESGLVARYARPGGNVTGFTGSPPELETKRLQILKDVVPGLSRVAVMWNSANTGVMAFYRQVQAAAAALGVTLQPVVEVGRVDDLSEPSQLSAGRAPTRLLSWRIASYLRTERKLLPSRQSTDCQECTHTRRL
jgi:putative tryptophan/tyrosine transport system substrate-binding protein